MKESIKNPPRVTTRNKNHNSYNSETDTMVYALGGLGEVGKNMYCIEHDE